MATPILARRIDMRQSTFIFFADSMLAAALSRLRLQKLEQERTQSG